MISNYQVIMEVDFAKYEQDFRLTKGMRNKALQTSTTEYTAKIFNL